MHRRAARRDRRASPSACTYKTAKSSSARAVSGGELFIILEGTVVVTRAGRVVNEWGPGDYFGELAAIEAAPRSATVTATSDLDVLIVGPREFEAMMEIPGFRNALLIGMSRRIREADDKLAALAETEEEQEPSGS